MKVTLKNLGLLKQAEFTLGDLTIICGGNNMGKTYATYALFGFLYFWHEQLSNRYHSDLDLGIDIDLDERKVSELISNGVITINLQEIIVNQFKLNIDSICREYSRVELAKVFAVSLNKVQDSEVRVDIDLTWEEFKLKFASSFVGEEEIYIDETKILHISKDKDLRIKIELVGKFGVTSSMNSFLNVMLPISLKAFVFSILVPKPFIISSERTGVATFRKELDFARNRMLKSIAHHVSTDRDMDTIASMLQRGYQDYPLPVEQNVEFTRNLEKIVKQRSFIADLHPEILNEFADMIGGDYQVASDNILSYVPHKYKKLKLSLTESSSAIRSLLDLGFYLRHQAAVGDLLMIDEPELNLHPDNQRRIARLLARLVNLGIKVFITTHSSYIIKELNTLIMLNRDEPHLKQIAVEENYLESELLSPDKVKVYIAKEALVQLDGQKKKTRSPTLVPAKISPELGIELTSFDTAINTINRIQERIVWGSD